VLKSGASGRDPALRGSCKCSHISPYAALSKSPRILADGPMLVFQHPGCPTAKLTILPEWMIFHFSLTKKELIP
jgi:hypothetical protein